MAVERAFRRVQRPDPLLMRGRAEAEEGCRRPFEGSFRGKGTASTDLALRPCQVPRLNTCIPVSLSEPAQLDRLRRNKSRCLLTGVPTAGSVHNCCHNVSERSSCNRGNSAQRSASTELQRRARNTRGPGFRCRATERSCTPCKLQTQLSRFNEPTLPRKGAEGFPCMCGRKRLWDIIRQRDARSVQRPRSYLA